MGSPAKKVKIDEKNDVICGYVHNVSPVKTAVRTSNKFFNAVFQVNRDEFRNVVVFAADKRTSFLQANKNQSPVKLERIKRSVSRDGGEYDIQCSSSTDISVVANVGFSMKSPQLKYKTIAEVKTMAPKQAVAAVKLKVVHVGSATETIEVKGVSVDMQTCYVADHTDRIKLSLWETQVGALVNGKCYEITNLATREYAGDLYVTATRSTQIKEVPAFSDPVTDVPFTVHEGELTTLTAEISGVEVSIRHCCVKCHSWQAEFDTKAKFNRCIKCGLLQRMVSFQPTVTAKISVSGDCGDDELKLSNAVLKKHVQKEGLGNLLLDAQNVEEYLLEMGMCSFKMQKSAVIEFSKVKPDEKSGEPEDDDLLGEAANLLEGEMDSWSDECGETGSEFLLAETVPAEDKNLMD